MNKEPSDRSSLYGRVLQRLALALEQAERGAGDIEELEVDGLTPAELELIRAYLSGDSQWLSGWHAAAQEHARLARQRTRQVLRGGADKRGASHEAHHRFALRQMLSCALCQTEVQWPDSAGPASCPLCGSQLLRARRLRRLERH
ncbi:hypothetical protein [Pseudomonas oligotrophica]|uniref:hypothetical protein n=1 Tax=Pseudomonas oligotrophica TaxID=2912055 RepID=UPI001F1D4266|nr:hypothetical protein [Pseudomonas oligotrophica]MCF7201162.1 hypothetical protein [Pseudomonas oligotrophica]